MLNLNKFISLIVILVILYFSRVFLISMEIKSLTPAIKCQSVCNYHFEFEYWREKDAFKNDINGVIYVDYRKINSIGVGNVKSYNPISISLGALRYLDNSKLELFISQADWLVDNISDTGAWYIHHNKYGAGQVLVGPWPSSLAQGLAISVLSRAYLMTGDEKYKDAALKGIDIFLVGVEDGGIRSELGDSVFYEEYPYEKNQTHVLNGFIYSLFGLYDAYDILGSEKAKTLFWDGVGTLKNNIKLYDMKIWSRYDLYNSAGLREHWGFSSPWYQKLHWVQLDALYRITGHDEFYKYSESFESQESTSFVNYIIYPAYVVYTDFVKLYRFIL
ncbi:D-glucuronyl C5-epimerase family protein [Vibrio owensii]|nr:D-glucuronyl C5-epimerase family protein [Vibrio owensii]